jgi:hypothetical protein
MVPKFCFKESNMKFLRILCLAIFCISAAPGFSATLDGQAPLGGFALDIQNDSKLEYTELKRRGIDLATATGTNTITLTSTNLPFTALTNGMQVQFIAPATTTALTSLILDSTGTVQLDINAGTATVGGEIIAGQMYAARYVSATSHWRLQNIIPSSINNTPIGATSASTVAATTLTASSTVTLSPASANVVLSPTGTGTVAISPAGALTINPTAASTINNTSIGVTTAAAGKFTTVTATNLVGSTTTPTVSGFCTTPSVSANNGTWAFTVNVGTACAASTGTITLPAATTGWVCDAHNVTTPASNIVEMSSGTTTTVVLTNYVRSTGVAGNFTSSDVIRVQCSGF